MIQVVWYNNLLRPRWVNRQSGTPSRLVYVPFGKEKESEPALEKLSRMERSKSKDTVLNDERGIAGAINLGKRVAEMARIVRAGMSALEKELPSDYFYTLDELYCR